MQYPKRYSELLGYPFPRLRQLLSQIEPNPALQGDVLAMSIGEPRHQPPAWLLDEIAAHSQSFRSYPKNQGIPQLSQSILGYLENQQGIHSLDEQNIVPLNGTREGIFMAALALLPEKKHSRRPKVLIPNPFYQVYMMGALTLGLEPVFVPAVAENGFKPDYAALPEAVLNDVVAAYICTPSNPQGAIFDDDELRALIDLAERHDFMLFSDECYAEIYTKNKPSSAIKIAQMEGANLNRVMAFHSLSKRSNLPGLRSGFAVSGAQSAKKCLDLRGYAGAPIPEPLQYASARLWSEQSHADENRALYQEKMHITESLLGAGAVPEGGFFLWLQVGDDEKFVQSLYKNHGVIVLPGSYLGHGDKEKNPASGYIRVALVGDNQEVNRGLTAIAEQYQSDRGEKLWL